MDNQNTEDIQQQQQNQQPGEKIIISIYYQEQNQKVGFYKGTPEESVKQTLRLLFGINKKDEFIFQDEDGTPIVFSSQHVPDDSKFFIKLIPNYEQEEEEEEEEEEENIFGNVIQALQNLQQNNQEENNTQQPVVVTGPLQFTRLENVSHPTLFNNNKRAEEFQMIGKIADSMAFTDVKFEKGKRYYYELNFVKISCCMTVMAVLDKNLDETQGSQGNVSTQFNLNTSTKKFNVKVGVFVDFTPKNQWGLIDIEKNQLFQIYAINNQWDVDSFYIGVCTKHKEDIVEISDLKEYPSFLL